MLPHDNTSGWRSAIHLLRTFVKLNLLYLISLVEYIVTSSRDLKPTTTALKSSRPVLGPIKEGALASNRFSCLLPYFQKNQQLSGILQKIWMLNLGILLQFIVLEYVIVPFFEQSITDGAMSQVLSWISGAVYRLYHYPFLLAALIMNTSLYNLFALEGYKVIRGREPIKVSSFLDTSASLCLYVHLQTWAGLIGYLPFIGWLCSFVWLTCVNAYAIFDYIWGLQNMNILKRFEYFAGHLPFLFGFAFLPTLAFQLLKTYTHPVFFGPVFSGVFPLYILLAQASKPVGEESLKSHV